MAKIASSEESDEEDAVADRRRGTENYYQARVAFASAVSLFKQSEENAKKHHCLTGKLLELVSYTHSPYQQGWPFAAPHCKVHS